jgi:hypothetical protein
MPRLCVSGTVPAGILLPPDFRPPYTGAVFRLWSCVVSWSKRFDEPIKLPDGTTLRTLRDAVQYLAKTVPKAEQKDEKVIIAADHLTRSAEQG